MSSVWTLFKCLFIWLIDRILPGVTTLGHTGPGSNTNEEVLSILQSSKTGASPSDGLMSYSGYSSGRLTHLQRCSRCILQPQQNGLKHNPIYMYILKWVGPQRDIYFLRIYSFILFLHTCMFPACCFCQRRYMAQGLINGVLNETWTHLCL